MPGEFDKRFMEEVERRKKRAEKKKKRKKADEAISESFKRSGKLHAFTGKGKDKNNKSLRDKIKRFFGAAEAGKKK